MKKCSFITKLFDFLFCFSSNTRAGLKPHCTLKQIETFVSSCRSFYNGFVDKCIFLLLLFYEMQIMNNLESSVLCESDSLLFIPVCLLKECSCTLFER